MVQYVQHKTLATGGADMSTTYSRTFIDKNTGLQHWYACSPPTEWAAERGATHSLAVMHGNRPLRMLKTVCYVGVDEDADGNIVWEKWGNIRQL